MPHLRPLQKELPQKTKVEHQLQKQSPLKEFRAENLPRTLLFYVIVDLLRLQQAMKTKRKKPVLLPELNRVPQHFHLHLKLRLRALLEMRRQQDLQINQKTRECENLGK